MRILLVAGIVLLTTMHAAWARPVSYPGGWTWMQMNDADMHSLHVHYSPTAKYSLGYKTEYWREEEWQFHGLQLNYLVKRWNKPSEQANIYLKTAAGLTYSDAGLYESDMDIAGFMGMAADWETRRYFTMYENRVMNAGRHGDFFMQKARVGIAPYIGDYGDLHTWLMLQVDHNPTADDPVRVTPWCGCLRVFIWASWALAPMVKCSPILLFDFKEMKNENFIDDYDHLFAGFSLFFGGEGM